MSGIVFQVETDRVLKILASEIYDSPLALLRENVQNAYDAIRMRFAPTNELEEGKITVSLKGNTLSIADNGVGMTEQVLRENFWKAGSSGKNSQVAKAAGVVGTFGIGAMANFGVCTEVMVETRPVGSDELLRSVAERDKLKIAEECISFERVTADRDVGTTVTVKLDPASPIALSGAKNYLHSYVALLPVAVFLNEDLISQQKEETLLRTGDRVFESLGSQKVTGKVSAADCEVFVDPNGQVKVALRNITISGAPVQGTMALVQSGGQLMGLRSYFGLAPVPAIGPYQFGGFANLSFLQPTAGREALSRESIELITRLVNLAEHTASDALAKTDYADRNTTFLQWLVTNKKWNLADRVTVHVLPDDEDVPLGKLREFIGKRAAQYYTGTDPHIIRTFSNVGACLIQIAQSQPRRSVQLSYLRERLAISEVPDSVKVTRVYQSKELSAAEVSLLLRIASILRDDYLIPDVDMQLVDMSHGVTVLPERIGEHQLRIRLARSSALLTPLMEFRDKAYEVFGQFMKDFVRVHIYPRIQQFVPSSTRGGVEALRKVLERNRELYRYEESERGDLEGVLGDLLSGNATFKDVLQSVRGRGWGQSQSVSSDQVGRVENVVASVVESPVTEPTTEGSEFVARPPILREEISSEMKILTTDHKYPQLNMFTTLLGLSDRLMKTESDFFRSPHTTRIIWGGHRVIYIFTEASGQLSLYYDIELRDPIEQSNAGGGLFPTTTIVTGKRIFVPVPDALVDEFRVSTGSREFFVRFDLLAADLA